MKKITMLTKDEQEIESALEQGEYQSVPASDSDRVEWSAIARNTVAKN